jgi:hypothetical protein
MARAMIAADLRRVERPPDRQPLKCEWATLAGGPPREDKNTEDLDNIAIAKGSQGVSQGFVVRWVQQHGNVTPNLARLVAELVGLGGAQ